jgi:hypothetical protein
MERRALLQSLAVGLVGVAAPVSARAAKPREVLGLDAVTREMARLITARRPKRLRLVSEDATWHGDIGHKHGDVVDGVWLDKRVSVIFSPPIRLTGKIERSYDIHQDEIVDYPEVALLPVPLANLENLADQFTAQMHECGMVVCAPLQLPGGVAGSYRWTSKTTGLSLRGVLTQNWQASIRFDVLGAGGPEDPTQAKWLASDYRKERLSNGR